MILVFMVYLAVSLPGWVSEELDSPSGPEAKSGTLTGFMCTKEIWGKMANIPRGKMTPIRYLAPPLGQDD